jgi:signal transduction histidine kinase
MVVIRDITKGIKYEKLKLHSQLADMLTATISHDMRTPLNAIISVSKNLITDLANSRTCKKTWMKFLKIVFNSASLLNFQVNDLIDLFKIRTGKFKPLESIVNLHDVVMDIFEVFSI